MPGLLDHLRCGAGDGCGRDDGRGEGVGAGGLHGGGPGEQVVAGDTGCGLDVDDGGLVAGEGAGLVEGDGADRAELLERFT